MPCVHGVQSLQTWLLLAGLVAVGVGTPRSAVKRGSGGGPGLTQHAATALLEDAGRLQYTRPMEYLGALQRALEMVVVGGPWGEGREDAPHGSRLGGDSGGHMAPGSDSRVAVRLLQRLGDTALFLRRFDDALAYYREAHVRIPFLATTPSQPSSRTRELLASHAAIAKALRHAQRFTEATRELDHAQDLFERGSDAASTPSPTPSTAPGRAPVDTLLSSRTPEYSLLLKMRSQVAECAGDHLGALSHFEAAQGLEAALGLPPTTTDLRRHVDLLDKALSDPHTSTRVRSLAQARREADVARLVATGPWTSARQLPATLLKLPGMDPTPWFTAASYPQFRVIVDLLEHATPRLLTEFWDLWRAQGFTADLECIHSPTKGVWRAHSVGAPWQPPGSAPVARQLMAAIAAAQSLPLIRAEYSALDGGGHISPHYGMTNGQVKFHLGLLVPVHDGPGGTSDPCAFLTVDGERRPWVQGQTLIFDDSFKHHVDNGCPSLRVVFQVVAVHPAVAAARGGPTTPVRHQEL